MPQTGAAKNGRSFLNDWLGDGYKMKTAYVYKDRTGYWVAEDKDTRERIGGFHNTELQAYKAANSAGYVCR